MHFMIVLQFSTCQNTMHCNGSNTFNSSITFPQITSKLACRCHVPIQLELSCLRCVLWLSTHENVVVNLGQSESKQQNAWIYEGSQLARSIHEIDCILMGLKYLIVPAAAYVCFIISNMESCAAWKESRQVAVVAMVTLELSLWSSGFLMGHCFPFIACVKIDTA